MISRRGLGLALAGCAMGAGHAAAQEAVRFPLQIACARIGPSGLEAVSLREQQAWTRMQTRLGALVERVEALQPASLIGVHGPASAPDGGASWLLAARHMAAQAGFGLVVAYATHDGRRSYKTYENWLGQAFTSLRKDYGPQDRPRAEAHILDVGGGPPLATVTADARPRQPLNPFEVGRDAELEAITAMTETLEVRLQDLARKAFAAQRSIAGR